MAEKLAAKLGYDCISREILLAASQEFNIPEIKLVRAIEDAPKILERFTSDKKKYVAYIRAALLKARAKRQCGLPRALRELLSSGHTSRAQGADSGRP